MLPGGPYTLALIPSEYVKDEKSLKAYFISPDLSSSGAKFKRLICFQCQQIMPENSHSTYSKDAKILCLSAKKVAHMGPCTLSLEMSNP